MGLPHSGRQTGDIVVADKQRKNAVVIYVAITSDGNIWAVLAALVTTLLRHAISSFFSLYDLSLSPCLFLELWHLHAPLRKRWQKDKWPRYFRTQPLFLPQLAGVLSCIRTEEGCRDGREGKSSTISSVTNLVFTPGEEGKVIQQPPQPPPAHTPFLAWNLCPPSVQTLTQRHGCVLASWFWWPSVARYLLVLFWPERLTWLCALWSSVITCSSH